MLSEVIAEAKRFKRKNLVSYLSQEVIFDSEIGGEAATAHWNDENGINNV